MKLLIDTDLKTVSVQEAEETQATRTMPLYSDEAFELISYQWLKVGWNQRYPYTFTWLGRPIIQLPEDVLRIQEVVYRIKPTVIVETGVAHGGSLILYASLLHAMKIPGRVIGVDIEIRPNNRSAIEKHELASYVSLILGDSASPDTVQQVRRLMNPSDIVLVILDSCHTKAHVKKELDAYSGLVSVGSYIVATDGSMRDLHDVPLGKEDWKSNNPANAAEEFAQAHPNFTLEQPSWGFNESRLTRNITHWPSAFLKRTA